MSFDSARHSVVMQFMRAARDSWVHGWVVVLRQAAWCDIIGNGRDGGGFGWLTRQADVGPG